ncbi:hypothetical protein HGO97_000710 [Faecalicatena sp. AGMB00832]|uniref:Na+/glutamate symporter n=1 Tax=Faecalicatena faecalis TaxID=2726362 RepID=A0ABS6CYD7_9FIRM|nr:hypothetical protein [Faecalicatena faecalis]MBU3874340.1 hypothetical protein [Faecalicatena faecalis]
MGTEYTWAFDRSFLVFLAIAFVSLTIATKLKSMIPMPLIYGILFAIGFGTGILPTDMLLSANMIAVGTIAFNVLVIHSGTMINFKMLKARKKEAFLCIAASLALVVIVGFGLTPILGKGLAFLSPGSVIGGGASCAIASRWVLDKNPAISVFPWLVFMFQGLFSVPVVTWALKRESRALSAEFRARSQGSQEKESGNAAGNGASPMNGAPGMTKPDVPGMGQNPNAQQGGKVPFCERIPAKYKNTAYYLGIIMIVTVINNLLHGTVLAGMNINPNITALLFGCILGSLGLMDKAPLFKADSYGLLLMGLMGLMANTIARCPWQGLVSFLPPLLLVFVVSTVVLVICGIVGAKICGFRAEKGIALTMNCMMGFPVNDMLTNNAAAIGESEAEKGYIKSQIGPVLGMGTMLISNAVSVLIVSLMVIFV